MALTKEENRRIAEGAEAVRRRQEAEEDRQKTIEFQEMKKRNEARPAEKPMPTARELVREKAVAAGERIGQGISKFLTAPNTPKSRRSDYKPRRRAAPAPRRTRRRAAPRQPVQRQPDLLGGSFSGLNFTGELLGGFGSAPRRKRGNGGWGLL
jgi:hypothetical protein